MMSALRAEGKDDVELRTYLAVLAKRWPVIVVVFLVSVTVAVGVVVLTTPIYRAHAQLFVSTQVSAGNLNQELYQGSNFSSERVKSYTELVTSPTVLEPVVSELRLGTTAALLADDVRAAVPVDTVLIDIEADAQSPELAAALANSVGDNLAQVIEDLEAPGRGRTSPVRATLVTPALVPVAPFWPAVPLILGAGLLLGLIAGVSVALLREKLDVSIRSAEELAVVNLPSLAEVSRDRRRGAAAAIVRSDPQGSRSEAYRQLRTNLHFAALGNASKVMVVTSALPGEGKSSVAGNLALALSQVGQRVCLIDGDLRRPSVATYFGLIGSAGLSTVIVGRASLDDVLQPVDGGLVVITSGPIPPNPTELLGAPSFTRLLGELRNRFDTVIVDAPPVLPAADAAVLAAAADGVIFVVRAGRTGRHQVQRAVAALDQVHAPMLGAVLNMVRFRGSRKRMHRYGHTYRSEGVPPGNSDVVPTHGAPPSPDGHSWAYVDGQRTDVELVSPRPRPYPRSRNGDNGR